MSIVLFLLDDHEIVRTGLRSLLTVAVREPSREYSRQRWRERWRER